MRMSRAEQQHRTREEVLAAADRLFVEQGFHATSVDQIAQAAGYTKGAVYSNFAAKEDLFFAVYEQRMDKALAELERTLGEAADPAAWIESVMADTSSRRGRDDRWLSTFFEFWAHVIRRPALRERFAAIHARLEVPFVAAVRRHAEQHDVEPALDPLQTHLALASMSLGLTLERLLRPDVVHEDTGTRISRVVLGELVKGADDVGAHQPDGDGRAGAAPRARAGRA
jgi:AcrR family transcriptional regulator